MVSQKRAEVYLKIGCVIAIRKLEKPVLANKYIPTIYTYTDILYREHIDSAPTNYSHFLPFTTSLIKAQKAISFSLGMLQFHELKNRK